MGDRNEHKNDYKNKYFSILGDSISTFEHYSEPDYAAYYDVSHKLEADVLTMYDTWWGDSHRAFRRRAAGQQFVCRQHGVLSREIRDTVLFLQ